MVIYGSGLGDGNRHTHHDLPVILAGRGAGTFRTGRHIRYPQAAFRTDSRCAENRQTHRN